MSIERFTCKWDELEIPDGTYVRDSDYAAAIMALRSLRQQIRKFAEKHGEANFYTGEADKVLAAQS
jgi:hypothetical protein